MKKNPITAVLLDSETATIKKVSIEPTLDNYYKMLHCDLIEMPVRAINGKPFRIICDEEGALKDEPVISAVDSNFNPMLVGSLLFVGDDGSPYECSLSDEDCDWILNNTATAINSQMKCVKVVTNCEYC